jgi:hypothetical protein
VNRQAAHLPGRIACGMPAAAGPVKTTLDSTAMAAADQPQRKQGGEQRIGRGEDPGHRRADPFLSHAVKNVGMAMSRHVTAATGSMARRRLASAPFLAASGTRNAALSRQRPKTTSEGGMCATATRMNRNELPQMTDVAANSIHAFRFTATARCP